MSGLMDNRLVVGIATRGRPAILAETIAFLANQVRQPDKILVAYAEPADIADAPERFPEVTFIRAEVGLTRQRNAILTLAAGGSGDQGEQRITPTFFAYGCNMCMRMAPIRQHDLRFDETLPLYGWYEDWDFSRQLAAFGSIVHISNACGVHLSTKVGRITGIRMGYAQVANPIYLARKGTFPWSHVFKFIVGPCLKNLVRSLAPEAHVDRLGRFCGNLAAFRDLLTGTLSPTQIVDL